MLIQMHYKPHGPFEVVKSNKLRIQRRRVRGDLRLFKHFLELRGEETGAWRGTIGDESGQGRESNGADRRRSSGTGQSEAGRRGDGRSSNARTTRPAAAKRTSASKSGSGSPNGRGRAAASSAPGAIRSSGSRRSPSSSQSSSTNGRAPAQSSSSNGRAPARSTRARAASR